MTEPTDKQLPDEQQLEDYLKGDSSVSRHYRQLHSAEVPAELDRLVLGKAEDAVKSRSSKRPAWVRWSAPFAVAASAVLALTIVIETGLRDETMVAAPEQAMQERARAPIETRIIGEEPAQGAAPESPVSNLDGPQALRLEMPEAPAEEAEEPAVLPPPPIAASAPADVAPQAAARSRPAPPPVAAPAPEAKALSKQAVANDAADAEKREEVAKAAQSANEEAFAVEAAREEERSAAHRNLRVDQPLPQLTYSRPISADMATLPRTYSDPEEWLKDIRQLRKDDKKEEADKEWRRFRATFPNYEVAETDLAREAKK